MNNPIVGLAAGCRIEVRREEDMVCLSFVEDIAQKSAMVRSMGQYISSIEARRIGELLIAAAADAEH
jgi:hypothetical protein